MAYGWEGEKVRLVPLDKSKHLENALLWVNDPVVTAWTLIGDAPLTRLGEEQFFDQAMRAGEGPHFAVETLAGEHIGFSGLHRIEWPAGVGVTGTLLGRRDLWGQGYGSDAARVRTGYCFEVLGLRMLLSEVMVDNIGSVRMLKKAGYREVGHIPRRVWKRGAYRDVVILVLERE